LGERRRPPGRAAVHGEVVLPRQRIADWDTSIHESSGETLDLGTPSLGDEHVETRERRKRMKLEPVVWEDSTCGSSGSSHSNGSAVRSKKS
jgi:hypothetical protein